MNQLKKRILEISYKHKLSHIASCITAVDIIDTIFKVKKLEERFVLSAGHAGLALYVVLEKYKLGIMPDAERLFEKHGVHPNRNDMDFIDCSTGSLGQGLPIAVGMALADRSKNVFCLISDGETAEGSIWEALRIAGEQKLDNLKIVLNYNGWGAYGSIDLDPLIMRFQAFGCGVLKIDKETDLETALKAQIKNVPIVRVVDTREIQNKYSFLKGQKGHYYILSSKEEYEKA